jgi:hypothetical protein
MSFSNVNPNPIDVPMAFNLPDRILLADHIILGAGTEPERHRRVCPSRRLTISEQV